MPKLDGGLLDEPIDVGVDDVCEHGALRQNRRGEDRSLLGSRVDVVEVELHDDEVGALDELVDRRRQRMIARPQHVHRAEQRDFAAVAVCHAPRRGIGGREADRQRDAEQRKPSSAVHDRAALTQLTSVSMRPSSWSSIQRMPGGRSSSAKNSLPGRNCAQVDGVLKNRTRLRVRSAA